MKKQLNQYISSITPKFSMELLQAFLPTLLVIMIGVVLVYKFVDPAPPRKIIMSISQQEGNYKAFASIYQILLKQSGINLLLKDSGSASEDLKQLKNADSGVNMAIIQDGIASTDGSENLISLGSLYYEPAWIFCRCKQEITHLADLKGKRIAVGKPGSGTRKLAMTLLDSSGIDAGNSVLLPLTNADAANALRKGKIDAAFFIDSPESAFIRQIAQNKALKLISLDDAEAFTREFPYLHHLVLPEGSLDLERNIPEHDIHLLSPTAVLVARNDLHPALVYLMLKIISQVHSGFGLLNKEREFPADKDADFPLSEQAERFYQTGLPFLDKYLPFWAATFVSRMLIVIVPLLALLIPLTKIIPMIYVWLVKMKLYRYYGELRFLETQLPTDTNQMSYQQHLVELNMIESKVNQLKLPISFSQHLYELRAHIELVRIQLERHGKSNQTVIE